MKQHLIYHQDGEGFYKVFHNNGVYCGDIIMKEDGFYDWWPEQRAGYLPAWFLREIADKLDELNAPYEKAIDEYFTKQDTI